MKKSTLYTSRILLAAGLAVTFGAAQAVPITFDFGAAAVGNEQGNPAENDAAPVGLRFDGSGNVFTNGFAGTGLQVMATGQNQSGVDTSFAYLDGRNNAGRLAGLGVCQTLADTQCNPGSDDNVTGNPDFEEQLTLTFNSLVGLSGLTFRGEEHFRVDDTTDASSELEGTETLLVNGVEKTFAEAELASFTGGVFTFGYGGSAPEQFYLGAATAEAQDVPGPAGIGLLGFGLLGLGAAIRRRRNIG